MRLEPLPGEDSRTGTRVSTEISEVDAYWRTLVADMQVSARVGDRVLIDAPVASMAAPHNGMEGTISAYPETWPGWVLVRLDAAGDILRFRPDEMKQL